MRSILPIATLVGLVACKPKTIEYTIEVQNDYPGTRVGIFRETGGSPLATTTHEREKLVVKVGFEDKLTARFVDAPDLPGVRIELPELDADDRSKRAKAGLPVARHAFASLRRSEEQFGWVEVVLATATDEPITIGNVSVDSKIVPPGTRLIVPTKTDGRVTVKVGSAVTEVDLGGRAIPKSSPYPPNALVYVDPTGSACLQVRSVLYGNTKFIGMKPGEASSPPKRLAPAKLHVFRSTEIPDVLVDEKVPDYVSGMGVGHRSVFERCPTRDR